MTNTEISALVEIVMANEKILETAATIQKKLVIILNNGEITDKEEV